MIDIACEKRNGYPTTEIRIMTANICRGTTNVRIKKCAKGRVLSKMLGSREARLNRGPPDSIGVGLTVRIIRGADNPGDGRDKGKGTLLEPEMTIKA